MYECVSLNAFEYECLSVLCEHWVCECIEVCILKGVFVCAYV